MKHSLVLAAALFVGDYAYGQSTLRTVIKDDKTGHPIVGATEIIRGLSKGAISDASGQTIIADMPNGTHILETSSIGYRKRIDTLRLPSATVRPIAIFLKPIENIISEIGADDGADKLAEVTVSATRTSRTIANLPTRVETISGEELDEKGNMKPGDIRMLLAESTGIQTQQTTAASGNAAIRIQGLDGKYTQIIRDGFPLYGNFSGGLGLLQTAPLDLKQVEVIKGSLSTLYGGGAIAGLVNLVSKTPTEDHQLNVLLNGTSAKGLDASIFYGAKLGKVGTTFYAAYNHGSPYDPAGIDLTAIPRFNRFTINPKLWIYMSDHTTVNIGVNATRERRLGGDMDYILGHGSPGHTYFEQNNTGRYNGQIEVDHQLQNDGKLTLRSSVGYFERTIELPNYKFAGTQVSSYTELVYNRTRPKAEWVAGLNYVSDRFAEQRMTAVPLRDYAYRTIGGFLQNTFNTSEKIVLETGIRTDYHNAFGLFVLPRASVLWRISRVLSSRLGGGLGYKAPTVFTEDAERVQFQNVLPLEINKVKAERSYGLNYDINYRNTLDGVVGFSVNQLFFFTRINHPILLTQLSGGDLRYEQPRVNLRTEGMETNVKFTYRRFKLFTGYTWVDVIKKSKTQKADYPLVSRHRLNNVLVYEEEGKWKIGLEAYYFSRQLLNDGSVGKAYWTTGFMAERIWERWSIFFNFENLTDTRQTKFDTVYTGPITNPNFRDIYAPLDGFIVNGGLKFRLR